MRNRVTPGSPVLGQVLRGSPTAQRPPCRPGATNGKRSRREGAASGYVQNGLLSVPTPIRSTSAPSLPGEAPIAKCAEPSGSSTRRANLKNLKSSKKNFRKNSTWSSFIFFQFLSISFKEEARGCGE